MSENLIASGVNHNTYSHQVTSVFIYFLQTDKRTRHMHAQTGLWSWSRRLGLRRQTSRSHLCLGHLRLVPKTNFRPNCAGHSTQCERALDVVSLCCSYYCTSY